MFDIHTHIAGNPDSVLNLSYNDLAEPLPKYFSLGIHPWDIKEETLNDDLDKLRVAIETYRPTFMGECGIDKVCSVPIKLQNEAFRKQVELAIYFELPLMIHCVRAASEVVSILRNTNFNNLVVFHGIRSGFRQIKPLADYAQSRPVFFSFGKYICEETIKAIPLEKILLESDEGKIEETYTMAENLFGKSIYEVVCRNWKRALGLS